MCLGYRRRVNNQGAFCVFESLRHKGKIVFVMYLRPFGVQFRSKLRRCPVVSRNGFALMQEVTSQGTHPDPPGSYEINIPYLMYIHVVCNSAQAICPQNSPKYGNYANDFTGARLSPCLDR